MNSLVSSYPAGLSIRYGWFSTNQRDFGVGGITARRNLIEMLLDRVLRPYRTRMHRWEPTWLPSLL